MKKYLGRQYNRRQPDIPACKHRKRRCLGINDFLANDGAKLAFHERQFYFKLNLHQGQFNQAGLLRTFRGQARSYEQRGVCSHL
jgi:hypothetical protein